MSEEPQGTNIEGEAPVAEDVIETESATNSGTDRNGRELQL